MTLVDCTIGWLGITHSDGDGVPDALEDLAPNGGDGNGDGTPDREQGDVASLPDGEDVGFVTLEVSGGCSSLSGVATSSESAAAEVDPSLDYPLGLVEFTAPCASATVKIFFHGSSSLLSPYRKYGPTTPGLPATAAWYTLPTATFGLEVVGSATVTTATLVLTDGQLGDDTGIDGQIVDLGGPVDHGAPEVEVPAMSAATRGVLIGFLLALPVWLRRKRSERIARVSTSISGKT